jgi:hypothetical protein
MNQGSPNVADLATSRESLAKAETLFRDPQYRRHNARRQEHLASLGLDLHNKSVLELGAGIGDHTTFFLDRDCRVLSVEPRSENCTIFAATIRHLQSLGYSKAVHSRLMRGDIETIDRAIVERFDIVYCYGLLYHVADPASALRVMADRCDGLLLLETCVSFGSNEAIHPISEPRADPTQAFRGVGCRPTRPWIFNSLKRLFSHVYVPLTQPDHEEFPLDWTAPAGLPGLTRAIFVASRRSLANVHLVDRLLEQQTRL